MKLTPALAVLAALLLAACASAYRSDTWTGGYSESQISDGVWRVRYAGNGYTTEETVQTYWLYRCAEVALKNGYQGFKIVTPVRLTAIERSFVGADGPVRFILTHGGGGGGGGGGHGGSRSGGTFVYSYGGGGVAVDKPALQGDIQLLKTPFTPVPARVFDAAKLQALLDPYVNGPKCNGNVCPFVHSYLFPPLPAGAPR